MDIRVCLTSEFLNQGHSKISFSELLPALSLSAPPAATTTTTTTSAAPLLKSPLLPLLPPLLLLPGDSGPSAPHAAPPHAAAHASLSAHVVRELAVGKAAVARGEVAAQALFGRAGAVCALALVPEEPLEVVGALEHGRHVEQAGLRGEEKGEGKGKEEKGRGK